MRIGVDVSVFYSPKGAFGYASGEMEVSEVPRPHEHFPWPQQWVIERPEFFGPEQSLVMTVGEFGDHPLVMLFGIVCKSLQEARDCVAFLEERGGLCFDEFCT